MIKSFYLKNFKFRYLIIKDNNIVISIQLNYIKTTYCLTEIQNIINSNTQYFGIIRLDLSKAQ